MAGSYEDRQLRASGAIDTRTVLIPSNWENLDEKHMCSIASQLARMPIHGYRNARAIIKAELRRRG